MAAVRSCFSCSGRDPARGEKAEAQQHFFLPRRFEDPFGNVPTVDYDAYDLLPVQTTDAVGNTVTAANDYRVLSAVLVTDPNGNRSAAAFDALGHGGRHRRHGQGHRKPGRFACRLFGRSRPRRRATLSTTPTIPTRSAGALLGTATTRIVYDLLRFFNSRMAAPGDPTQWLPVFAATIARETHVSDLAQGQATQTQINFGYSDGFGRTVQKKVQAEPRWVGSGWTIFNNKGKPVRQYEPFFSQLATKGHQFEFGVQVGVSPILFYDPVERVVATVHPDHTYEKIVFDPWHQETWDVNDTVLVDNPAADADVGRYLALLPASDFSPTWYAQRISGDLGAQEQDAATKAAPTRTTPHIATSTRWDGPF